MSDEYLMPPAERAAYANGYAARQREVDDLMAEIGKLQNMLIELHKPQSRPRRKRDLSPGLQLRLL